MNYQRERSIHITGYLVYFSSAVKKRTPSTVLVAILSSMYSVYSLTFYCFHSESTPINVIRVNVMHLDYDYKANLSPTLSLTLSPTCQTEHSVSHRNNGDRVSISHGRKKWL